MAHTIRRFREWLRDDEVPHDLGEYVVGVIFYAWFVLFLLHQAMDTDADPLVGIGWFTVVAAAGLALGYTLLTRFWRRWMFWRSPRAERPSVGTKLAEFAIVVAAVGPLFIALHVMLVATGHVAPEPDLLPRQLLMHSAEYLGWQLLDAVPVLDLTGSFELTPRAGYSGTADGVLLVAWKALLITPLVGLLVSAVRPAASPGSAVVTPVAPGPHGWPTSAASPASPASSTPSPGPPESSTPSPGPSAAAPSLGEDAGRIE